MTDDSRCYWIMLYDPKGEMISKKLLRIFPGEEDAAEYLAKLIGGELGRDAIADMKDVAS